MTDTEDIAAVVAHIAATFPGREGEVLAGLLIHALAHFVYQPDAASFCAALNTRLFEVAQVHGARPWVLMELATETPPRH